MQPLGIRYLGHFRKCKFYSRGKSNLHGILLLFKLPAPTSFKLMHISCFENDVSSSKGVVIKYVSWGGGRRLFGRGMKENFYFKRGVEYIL